jgi:hypothetical protein
MGGERVAQRVTRGALCDAGASDGILDGALQHGLVKMMATALPRESDHEI